MPSLDTGIIAPDFTLTTVDGKRVSLGESLKKGPVLLAFFKISCPVCQYAFPFFERVFQSNRDGNITVLGISQDTAKNTKSFIEECGVTFPVAIDEEANHYRVSNAYGLTNVPTAFLIAPNRDIEVSCVGWSKRDVETINAKLAQYRNSKPRELWRKGEQVSDYRAG